MAGLILLTGATGYIGSRLLRVLEEGGCVVRCLARQPARVATCRPHTEMVTGDCLDEESLVAAMEGVDQAFYLVHSMATGPEFTALDRRAAANFGRAAASAGVRRIIYLGGLGDDRNPLSTHLQSRAETGRVLRDSGVPVVEFRASIVIGGGSTSFEIIRALVERLPAMICPRWVETPAQPIAIDDVLAYLRAALDLPEGSDGVFEIGGPEVLSYGDIMRAYAHQRGLRRLLITVPVLSPRLSGLWLGLVTPRHARIGRALVEGLRNPTVVRSSVARETFGIDPMPLAEALARAIAEDADQYKIDSRVAVVDAPPARVFSVIRRIGGGTGWYFADSLWRLRAWIDRRLGGTGMPRMRRHPDECVAGDLIDGWRVDAYEPDRLLRLTAGLKLPGRGWLEFRVDPLDDGRRALLRQTATFDPRGVMGRLYWYGIFPLHVLVFRGLLREIAGRAAPAPKIADVSVFTHATVLDATAAAAFHWHEQPGAVTALTPRALVRITAHTGGIRNGGRVALSIGVGPARIGWTLRHHDYVPERQFCDTQVRGPFALWRHTHRFDPVSPTRSLYQDRIEFAVCRHHVMNRLATAMLRPLLTLAFAQRHRVVRSFLAADRHRITRRWAAAALVTMMMMLPLAVAHADTPAVRTVAAVDLNRYAGDWFEIARFPNRFQRQCVGDVRAHYARRSDGRIDVVNRCQTAKGGTEARGIARIVDTETFAKLKVRFAPALLSFLPVVWGDYWVIGLAPDYSWAVVGSPDRDYLWILARTPTLDAGALTSAKDAARTNGFDVERLVLTPQSGR